MGSGPTLRPAQWIGEVADAQEYSIAILAGRSTPRRRLKVRWRADQSARLSLEIDVSDRSAGD